MVSLAILASLLIGPEIKEGLVYRTVNDQAVAMDLYLPEKPVTNPPPVVVMIHGGAWISGSRKEMAPLALELANRGVAVANIDYRLAPKSKWPAQIEDCQEAVLFVRSKAAEYGYSPDKVGAIGGSAGAHLSLLLGSTDFGQFSSGSTARSGPNSRVMAVVNLFGPVDMTQDFEKNVANMVSLQVIGKKYEDAKAEQVAFSPITYISKTSAPVFTVQGKADPLVPFQQAVRLETAMKNAGVPNQLILVDGMGHGVTSKDTETDKTIKSALAKALDWLVDTLKR